MKNLSTRQRLLICISPIAVSLLLVVLIGVNAMVRGVHVQKEVHALQSRGALAMDVRGAAYGRAVEIRNLALAEYGQLEARAATVKAAHAGVQSALLALETAVQAAPALSTEERQLNEQLKDIESRYSKVAVAIADELAAGRHESGTAMILSDCAPLLAEYVQISGKYVQQMRVEIAQAAQALGDGFGLQRNVVIVAGMLSLLVGGAMSLSLLRWLSRSLGAEPATLASVVQRIASGDLRPVAEARGAHPKSVLGQLQSMCDALAGTVGTVRLNADSVAVASAEIAQGNLDLNARTEDQASALEQTAAAMDELQSTVRQNADNASQGAQLAHTASDAARQGGSVVTQVVETMRSIHTSSSKIAEIISVIDGIAFQTNILALNAAVEAARAGEQGRGFAVVAGEVRLLAQRSSEASREIRALITESVDRVQSGTALADRAGIAMGQIVESIQRVSAIVSEISVSSAEQSRGIDQVGAAVTAMDQSTQQNAALVEESAAAAERLRRQATELVQVVSMFQLSTGVAPASAAAGAGSGAAPPAAGAGAAGASAATPARHAAAGPSAGAVATSRPAKPAKIATVAVSGRTAARPSTTATAPAMAGAPAAADRTDPPRRAAARPAAADPLPAATPVEPPAVAVHASAHEEWTSF